MSGGTKARWKDEEFPTILLQKANDFIASRNEIPFFLFLSLSDIHVPRDPNPMFIGKSIMGRRGDDIAQMDWITGQVMQMLARHNISKNTLVIFTSDNGPILDDGYSDDAEEMVDQHKPAGPFRGGKYSAYEGGTRMPTIFHWPSVIKPGVSDALISQVDLYASLASLVKHSLEPTEAPDSYDVWDAMIGKSTKGRQTMLEESFTHSLRDGQWKYIAPQENDTPGWLSAKKVEKGLLPTPQLYNLQTDIEETKDVKGQHPGQLRKMQHALEQIQNAPSRPGYKAGKISL